MRHQELKRGWFKPRHNINLISKLIARITKKCLAVISEVMNRELEQVNVNSACFFYFSKKMGRGND